MPYEFGTTAYRLFVLHLVGHLLPPPKVLKRRIAGAVLYIQVPLAPRPVYELRDEMKHDPSLDSLETGQAFDQAQ